MLYAFLLWVSFLAAVEQRAQPLPMGPEWDSAENKEPIIITKPENAHALFKFAGTTEEDWWFAVRFSVLRIKENGDIIPVSSGRSAVCTQPSVREITPRRCWRVEVKMPPGIFYGDNIHEASCNTRDIPRGQSQLSVICQDGKVVVRKR